MKAISKIQYRFADAKKTDLWNGRTRSHSHITAILTFHIVKDSIYFLSYRFTNVINFCH